MQISGMEKNVLSNLAVIVLPENKEIKVLKGRKYKSKMEELSKVLSA